MARVPLVPPPDGSPRPVGPLNGRFALPQGGDARQARSKEPELAERRPEPRAERFCGTPERLLETAASVHRDRRYARNGSGNARRTFRPPRAGETRSAKNVMEPAPVPQETPRPEMSAGILESAAADPRCAETTRFRAVRGRSDSTRTLRSTGRPYWVVRHHDNRETGDQVRFWDQPHRAAGRGRWPLTPGVRWETSLSRGRHTRTERSSNYKEAKAVERPYGCRVGRTFNG